MRRNTVPSIATLEAICHGLGISMAQFFAENDMVELTSDVKELFDCWSMLTPMQKDASLYMMKAMSNNELAHKKQETM